MCTNDSVSTQRLDYVKNLKVQIIKVLKIKIQEFKYSNLKDLNDLTDLRWSTSVKSSILLFVRTRVSKFGKTDSKCSAMLLF